MIVIEILGALVLLLVIAGLVAPMESLGWWARTGREDSRTLHERNYATFHRPNAPEPAEPGENTGHYLVFFSGIGISSGELLPLKEAPVVERLKERIGGTTMITDVYPYSPANRGLTANRPFSWLWRRLTAFKQASKHGKISFLINIRNAFQCFVSIDQRYGPVYNLGVAEQIWEALLRRGYDSADPSPVTILGWSGGAQIAVGASWYLASLGIPVHVLSMAGIFGSDPGIDRVKHLWHLTGSLDKVHRLGVVASAGRWPIARNSSWNRAKREGRVTEIDIGPLSHSGEHNYFAAGPPMEDGRQPREHTVDALVKVLVARGFAYDREDQPPKPASTR
ncbi:MAG TPA: hypothetical protein VFC82_05250 [Actinomycetaceae bacterium]|nr:hypothetical protein [Actinomycetaceae bacterium]